MGKQFYSVHKRSGKKFILEFGFGSESDSVIAKNVETGAVKEVKKATIKRWHEVGEEIKPESKKKANKNSGKDKRKKVSAEQVREIRKKKNNGASISSLAKEYGLSYSGMYWIVKGNTWAKLDQEEQDKLYWYEYRLRGCSPGCQPNGFVKVDHEHGRFGAVAYDHSLTDQEINDYELNPMG